MVHPSGSGPQPPGRYDGTPLCECWSHKEVGESLHSCYLCQDPIKQGVEDMIVCTVRGHKSVQSLASYLKPNSEKQKKTFKLPRRVGVDVVHQLLKNNDDQPASLRLRIRCKFTFASRRPLLDQRSCGGVSPRPVALDNKYGGPKSKSTMSPAPLPRREGFPMALSCLSLNLNQPPLLNLEKFKN